MFYFFVLLAISLIVVEAIMLLFWLVFLVRKNVGIVDIAWGFSFVATMLVIFILGEGYFWRKFLVLGLVTVWAFRLTYYIIQKFRPEVKDPRYKLILQKWPLADSPWLQALLLFLFQGLLVVIISIPLALMGQNRDPFFTTLEVFGLLLVLTGIIGETIADQQLFQFKKNPSNQNLVFDQGLWRYSRHPNYFFESIIWIGFGIMALSSPFGWMGLISPILILYLLLKVSGVSITDQHLVETKGNSYVEYQRRTSSFIPWF